MTPATKKTKAEEEVQDEPVQEPDPNQEQEPTGPVQSPVEVPEPPAEVVPQTVPESAPEIEPQELAGGNVADDGIEDIDLPAPVVGQWVQIKTGDYTGHFAAYLGNVSLDRDGSPNVIQVRTRDADNVLLDVAYSDVAATSYSGGR